MDGFQIEEFISDTLERVRDGEIRPDQAEDLIKDYWKIPFFPEDFDKDDPKLGLWTIEMVITWIRTKNLRQVARHKLYEGKYAWNITDYSSEDYPLRYELVKLTRTSLFKEYVNIDGTNVLLSRFRGVVKEFLDKISISETKTIVTNIDLKTTLEIPSYCWSDIEIANVDGEVILCVDGVPKYKDPKFRMRDIVSIWTGDGLSGLKLYRRYIPPIEQYELHLTLTERQYAELIIEEYPLGIPLLMRSEERNKPLMSNHLAVYQQINTTDASSARMIKEVIEKICEPMKQAE
jgi:hypothetical protein